MERKPPPNELEIRDLSEARVRFYFTVDGLVIQRDYFPLTIAADDALTLVRWLLWHALYGRWKPRE